MGILGRFIAHKADEKIFIPATAKILEKPVELIDKKQKRMCEQTFEAKDGKNVLVIKQKAYEFNDKLNIYNEHKSLRYRVSGEFFSFKRHLHIYNYKDEELGEVKEKLFAIRGPLSLDQKPANFDFIVNGQRIAKLKTKNAFKDKLVLSNGWVIKGNIIGSKYKIYDKRGKELAGISNKAYFADSPKNERYYGYRIEYGENVEELLVLMVVLAIDIYKAPAKLNTIVGAALNKPL